MAVVEKVAMIGTGAMGLALLERLKLAGVNDVVCYDAHAPALDAARQLGFATAANAAEAARGATLIDIVVRTDQDMLDCVLGSGQILSAVQPRTLLLLHSS
ncbi:MAG TPA: NAD(P)-binding domain-containing protein, partial [Candidatus Binatus sp.]|nr:NAD(P)-binding domain-containing protein [Candidatus Binatus sp.]